MAWNVLFIEDERTVADEITKYLSARDYKVTWASTAREGLEDCRMYSFQLVMVDLMLPDLDGFELCKQLRLYSDVPIIVVSAKNEAGDKVRALDLGADDYVSKPFSLEELEARIRVQLRKNGEGLPMRSVMTYGELVISPSDHLVCLRDEALALTAKEFELLVLMARHPYRTFSKMELYNQVWQAFSYHDDRTVTVHIKKLREKLGDPPRDPRFIETVWGVGYRFIGRNEQK